MAHLQYDTTFGFPIWQSYMHIRKQNSWYFPGVFLVQILFIPGYIFFILPYFEQKMTEIIYFSQIYF